LTTKIVGGTIISPNGSFLSSTPVEIELVLAQGFVVTGSFSISARITIQSDINGAWQTPLEVNDGIVPDGTLYRVTEKIRVQFGGSKSYLIQVLSGLGSGVNQVAGLIVPAALPVGATYQAISSGPTGAPGYIVVADNTALLAISPKVEGQPVWVVNTDCMWVWNGASYELLSYPDFADATARSNALLAVAVYPGQATYLKSNDVAEGPVWQNSNNVVRPPWNLPWGEVAYDDSETLTGGITTTITDITGLSADWTAITNRKYLVIAKAYILSSVSNDIGWLYLRDGSGNVKDVAKAFCTIGGATQSKTLLERVVTGSGPMTRKLSAIRAAGSGTVQAGGESSTEKASIVVQDIGPSGAPV